MKAFDPGKLLLLFFPAGPGKVVHHSVDANTSAIFLNWTSPPGSKLGYKVEWTSGKSQSMQRDDTWAVLSDLIPGTSYTITITVVVGDNVTGEPYTLTTATSNLLFRQLPCSHFGL